MEERNEFQVQEFLEETIKIRPRSSRRIMRRMFEVAMFAVVFGLVACVTMLVVSPILEEKLFTTPSNEVTFPEESMQYIKEEVQPEDMILEEKIEEPTEEPSEETKAVNPEEELLKTFLLLKDRAKACRSWLVDVICVSKEVSWLESTNANENQATGAIIADNGTELLILVENSCVQDADEISVIFVDGISAKAVKKSKDTDADLAVLTVDKESLSEKTLTACSIVEMTSSNDASVSGSMVMTLGNTNGVKETTGYGFVTTTGIEANGWDINYRLIMTDIYGSSDPNGFLVNMKGQLLGILCNDFNSGDTKNLITAIGISELKKKIENMSNAKAIIELGVKATDVTLFAHEANEIPYGAYVLSVRLDSPAMLAGIQAGDVITKIGAKEVSGMNDVSYHLHQMRSDVDYSVVIMRQSQGTYKESTLRIKK